MFDSMLINIDKKPFLFWSCLAFLISTAVSAETSIEKLSMEELKDFQGVEWFTYEHVEEPKFQLQYPYEWETVEVGKQPFEVLSVGDLTYYTPIMKVMAMEERWYLPLMFSVEAFFQVFKSKVEDAELVSVEPVQLEDGTKAYLGRLNWTFPMYHGIEVTSLVLSTYHQGHWLVVNVIEARAEELSAELMQAVTSLRFN